MSYGIYTFMQIVMPTPKSFALWRILQCFSPERSSQWFIDFLPHILVVELGLTGLQNFALWSFASRSSRTTCSKSLALLRSSVSVLSVLRSGLLTFFSSLVIQESLINFAGERRRSRMTSHCELILGFCLSASYPSSWVRLRRNRVHFPNHTHIVFNDAYVGLVQWSISNREASHPGVGRKFWWLGYPCYDGPIAKAMD